MGRTSGGWAFNGEDSSIDAMSGYRSFFASILFDRNDITNSSWRQWGRLQPAAGFSLPGGRFPKESMSSEKRFSKEAVTSYDVHAWVVMPHDAHRSITTRTGVPLLQKRKGSPATDGGLKPALEFVHFPCDLFYSRQGQISFDISLLT